jgi:PDZ domain-containing protein
VSSSADTSDGMLTPEEPTTSSPSDASSEPPPPPQPPIGLARPGKRPWILSLALLVLVGLIISANVVRLPYFAFKPGQVRNTSGMIEVDADTYPADGSISYTTVSLGRVTLFRLIRGWLDPDVDIEHEDQVLQGRDSEENRQINLQLMDYSQQVATQVALEELGYDVPVHINGQLVVRVEEGFPAEGVIGVGDTIVRLEGEPIDDPADLDRLMEGKRPGDQVHVTVRPYLEETEHELTLTLQASEQDPERGIMGVQITPNELEFDFPVDVSFDTGQVGGPSAGLAFTLGLIDLLTPGELTGGEAVAVTGTIDSSGEVGPIGGAGQKAAAVREAGIDVFLVPSADYDSAVEHAGDVQVMRVDTLDEALAALARLGGNGLALPALGQPQPATTG